MRVASNVTPSGTPHPTRPTDVQARCHISTPTRRSAALPIPPEAQMAAGRPASRPPTFPPIETPVVVKRSRLRGRVRPAQHALAPITRPARAPRADGRRGGLAPRLAASAPHRTLSVPRPDFEAWAIAAFGLRTTRTTLEHGPRVGPRGRGEHVSPPTLGRPSAHSLTLSGQTAAGHARSPVPADPPGRPSNARQGPFSSARRQCIIAPVRDARMVFTRLSCLLLTRTMVS